MTFHVITGLPRSGSTLLTNILNQRDDTYASSTSALGQATAQLSELLSTSQEETSRLANIPGTAEHHKQIGRTLTEEWHDTDAPVVFDKGRGWARLALLLRAVQPEAGIIVVVRDPREVLASIEARNQQTGMYLPGESLFARCNEMIADTGIVGAPISGVEDLIRRNLDNVLYLTYDQLCAAPQIAMQQVERTCGLAPYDYDFMDVRNEATDLDVLYRDKFPHKGEGEVKRSTADWRDYLDEEIAAGTLARWPLFCRTFGYT